VQQQLQPLDKQVKAQTGGGTMLRNTTSSATVPYGVKLT
jgi:hypothetical protein